MCSIINIFVAHNCEKKEKKSLRKVISITHDFKTLSIFIT